MQPLTQSSHKPSPAHVTIIDPIVNTAAASTTAENRGRQIELLSDVEVTIYIKGIKYTVS